MSRSRSYVSHRSGSSLKKSEINLTLLYGIMVVAPAALYLSIIKLMVFLVLTYFPQTILLWVDDVLTLWRFPVVVVIEAGITGIARPAITTTAVIAPTVTAVINVFTGGVTHTETSR